MKMTTTLWILLAVAALELGGFAFSWLRWRFHERAGGRDEPAYERAVRDEPAHEPAGVQAASPPAG